MQALWIIVITILIVFLIFLIILVYDLKRTVNEVNLLLNELLREVPELAQNIKELTRKTSETVENINKNLTSLSGFFIKQPKVQKNELLSILGLVGSYAAKYFWQKKFTKKKGGKES